MREKFRQQLEEMYHQMVVMGGLCQQAIAVAVKTLEEEEDTAENLEAQVFALDGGDRRHGAGDRGPVHQAPPPAAAGGQGFAADHRCPENGHRLGAHWRPGLGHCGAGPVYSQGFLPSTAI